MRRIMNFMTVANKWEYVPNFKPPKDPIATWEKHSKPAPTKISEIRDDGFVHRTTSEPEEPPNAYKSLDRLLQWHSAFSPLFTSCIPELRRGRRISFAHNYARTSIQDHHATNVIFMFRRRATVRQA